jgi:hypothetical protein
MSEKKHVKMRTPEGVEYDVASELVEAKLRAGWKLFTAKDAPSAPQEIATPSEDVTIRAPLRKPRV